MMDEREIWFIMEPNYPNFTTHAINVGEKGEVELKFRDVFEALMLGDAVGFNTEDFQEIKTDFRGRGFVLCHNHPSGAPSTSKRDDMATMLLSHTAKILDFEMIDHWIVYKDDAGDIRMYSYANERPGYLRPTAMLFPQESGAAAVKKMQS